MVALIYDHGIHKFLVWSLIEMFKKDGQSDDFGERNGTCGFRC